MSTDEIEEIILKTASLTDNEKVRLAIYLLEQTHLGSGRIGPLWRDIRGSAPGLLEGQDVQEWVSRSRMESTARREAAL
jgi:hypothetical protein